MLRQRGNSRTWRAAVESARNVLADPQVQPGWRLLVRHKYSDAVDAILARDGRLRLWQAVLLRPVFLEVVPVFVMGKELLSM